LEYFQKHLIGRWTGWALKTMMILKMLTIFYLWQHDLAVCMAAAKPI